jgi:ribose-phosphate pyrophosphokinase
LKTINLSTGEGVQLSLFPDKQPHVNIPGLTEGDAFTVVCAITSSEKLLQLLQTANAIDNGLGIKKKLVIPYLMAARYDRLMLPGDSVDLQVVAELINMCGFEKVVLFDPHSDAASLLIKRSVVVTNEVMVRAYTGQNAVLICPDAGAAKKVGKYFGWNPGLREVIYCSKSRDLSTGAITLQVPEPETCKGRNCVIIDDICDGGGTFLAIARQIQPAHLALVVSHGIFSKGFEQLEQHFQQIIVSNSFRGSYNSPIVTMVNINF